MKKWLVIVLVFIVSAGIINAQGSTLRFLCVASLGCAYTPLTDEDIQLVFPEDEILIPEDVLPAEGAWDFSYPNGSMTCPGIGTIAVPDSPSSGTIDLMEDSDDLEVSGIAEDGTMAFDFARNLGPGTYVVEVAMEEGGGSAQFSVFWTMQSEESMTGFLRGTITSEGRTCTIQRGFEGTYAG